MARDIVFEENVEKKMAKTDPLVFENPAGVEHLDTVYLRENIYRISSIESIFHTFLKCMSHFH